MKQSILTAFAKAYNLRQGYDEENKAAWHKAGKAFFAEVIKDLGLPAKWQSSYRTGKPESRDTLSYNAAGIACSGDFSVTCPDFGLYISCNADKIGLPYYRGSTQRDPYGGGMAFCFHNRSWKPPQDLAQYAALLDGFKACAQACRNESAKQAQASTTAG